MSRGFTEEMAEAVAAVFAGNSLDGVYSHGVNRFPRVVGYLDSGDIDPNADAECVLSMGAIERWGGHRGVGPLNAKRPWIGPVNWQKSMASVSAGQIQCRICRPGEEKTTE